MRAFFCMEIQNEKQTKSIDLYGTLKIHNFHVLQSGVHLLKAEVSQFSVNIFFRLYLNAYSVLCFPSEISAWASIIMIFYYYYYYSDIPIDTFIHSFTDFFFFLWLKQDLAPNF